VSDSLESLSQYLKVKKYPSLFVLNIKEGELNHEEYEGDLKFNLITKFLDKYALKEKVVPKVNQEE